MDVLSPPDDLQTEVVDDFDVEEDEVQIQHRRVSCIAGMHLSID